MLREMMEANDYAGLKDVVARVMESKPEIILYYYAGKPMEKIEHSGGIVVGVEVDVLQRAREYASRRY